MKAGTQNHLKTKRLMRLARVPLYQAVGILETLWLLCQDCCDEGNIGKFTDDEIADYLGWDRPDSSELVRHLADSGWIDPDPTHRYVVHDWLEECPEYIRDRVRKRRARATNPNRNKTYDHSDSDKVGQDRASPEMSEVVPSIPNPTQPNPTQPIQTQPPPKSPATKNVLPGQRPSAGLVAGGGNSWDSEDTEEAVRRLEACGYKRVDALIRECRERDQSPLDIIQACDQFKANAAKFSSSGAIAEFLRTGIWPANGVKNGNGGASAASVEKQRQAFESLRLQLIKAGENEARNWDNSTILARAKERGLA